MAIKNTFNSSWNSLISDYFCVFQNDGLYQNSNMMRGKVPSGGQNKKLKD